MKKINSIKFFNLFKNKSLIFFVFILVFWWSFLNNVDFGNSSVFDDRDQDGLSDKEEYLYRTDPDNPDTDGDGYNDGVEVAAGYDPLKPSPGDKIIFESQIVQKEELEELPNLTDEFFKKLSTEKNDELNILDDFYNNPEKFSNKDDLSQLNQPSLTSEELEKMLTQVTKEVDLNQEMDLISEDELKILSEVKGNKEDKFEEEKEQIEKYFTQIFYVLSFNKPFAIEDQNLLTETGISYIEEIGSSINTGKIDKLIDLKEKSQKTYEECLGIKTPYKTKEIHQRTLSLIKYLNNSIEEEKMIDNQDPLTLALYVGKFQAAIMEGELIQEKVDDIIKEYEIEIFNDENLQNIINKN